MQKALHKQQKQEQKYQQKKILYSTLLEIVKSNPEKTYEFYKASLKNFEIEATSKRTLQRAIQKCKKIISPDNDSSPQKLLIDRKQILSRDQISEVKSYLQEKDMLNLTKQQLTDLVNEKFIDSQKIITQNSKFIYLNFDGFYQKQNQQQNQKSKQTEKKFDFVDDSFNPFEISFEFLSFEEQKQQERNAQISLFSSEDPIDMYTNLNQNQNAQSQECTENDSFAKQFQQSGFNFDAYKDFSFEGSNDQIDIEAEEITEQFWL